MRKGIDVSSNNGKVDWGKIKENGIEFAIIRMGYGSDFPDQDDKTVLQNAKECDRLGIPYGLYLYSYALNEQQAHSEAAHMIRIARQVNAALGCWYDMEDADQYKARHGFIPRSQGAELTNFCKIYLQDMKSAGFENVGVYASYDYFKNILDLTELRKAGKIWLAHWGISAPSIDCTVWQYTSNGRFDGMDGRFDLDIWYGDFPAADGSVEEQEASAVKCVETLAQEVIAGKWGNGADRKQRLTAAGYDYNVIQAKVNEIYDAQKAVYYTVVKGDTLSRIARNYGATVSEMAQMNRIVDPNKIYVGQKIRVK